MKIIAFVGETFHQCDDKCFAKPTSIAFLQDTFGIDKVFAASSAVSTTEKPTSYSSEIDRKHFYSFPCYTSTKHFLLSCLFNRRFLKEYIEKSDELIVKHKGDLFWIRTPSIGSIVFGLRVLKHDQVLLHHMCADASNTWKDAKYKGITKLFAFITSRLIRSLLKRICSNPNTINLCTGDVLESFSRHFSEKTFQFVDVMVKNVDTSQLQQEKSLDCRKRLLFVGRMVDDKGIFDLIEVINELKDLYTLTFVGDGPDLERAKLRVSQLKLEDTIEFTGQLAHESLSRLFCHCDLVAVPSNNNYEGFPRVIMEAWSFEKPVVISNVGGINAFVKDGENGLIVQPGNRLSLKNALIKCQDSKVYARLSRGACLMKHRSTQKYWSNKLSVILSGIIK